ncbi:ABC transporter substrate-binding protein [Marinobacterium aestuariivivens]|uniref:ABC transporter substrate-binding protein n=1 Tax=Marinobacterium aestuariivivens TaxID=1698799 RepID=A0ABW1ZVR4_9GAMM
MSFRSIFAGLLLVPLALLAQTEAQAQEKVRIGVAVSWPGYAFYELARVKNLAPDYALDITIYEDPLTGHNQLAAGNIDIFVSTLDYAPVAIEYGLPIVSVAYSNPSYGVDQVVLAPGVSADTIRGRKVAAPEAFIGQIMVGYWLEQNGVRPEEVDWVNLNADSGVGPMISGDLAAAYMYEPYTSRLTGALEGTRIVADTAQEDFRKLGLFGDAIFMNVDFIKKRRQAALDMLKARWDAVRYWHDNTADVNALWADYLQWPVEDIEAVTGTNGKYFLGGIYMFDFDEAAQFCGAIPGEPPFGRNGGFADAVATTNDWWVKLGVLKERHDPARGFDCSLIAELAEGGYRQSLQARP